MYVPPHNRERRLDVLRSAVDEIRFGSLVTVGAQGPIATHVPMFLDPDGAREGAIFGHVARSNPQWRTSQLDAPALAIFVGPYAYISPSFYETKRQTGKVVPTWQYLAVQARGPISFFEDRVRLHEIVRRSTTVQEAASAHPWAVEDAPLDYVQAMLGAIIGFEIVIESLEGAWKFSQNKNEADLAGVIDGLTKRGDLAVASLVRERGGTAGPAPERSP